MSDPSLQHVVVRTEAFGILLWSRGLDKYFLPATDIHDVLRDVLARARSGLPATSGLPPDMAAEFDSLGFNGTVREVSRPLAGRLSGPLDAYFDYTWSCTLSCSFCYNRNVRRDVTMPHERIRAVLHGLHELGTMRLHLAGGEPLVSTAHLETYLATADTLKMNASVNSNGILFDEARRAVLFAHPLVTLTFSLDGYDHATNSARRGDGSYERTVATVRAAVAEKHRRRSKTRIQLKAIWEPHTPLGQLEKLAENARHLGVDSMQFHNPERCLFHPKGHYGLTVGAYYERVAFIAGLRERHLGALDVWNVWNPTVGCGPIGLPGMRGCIGGQELLAINPDGSINPCLMNSQDLGNLFSDWRGDLDRFWKESPALQEFQEATRAVDGRCTDCAIYDRCRGGSKTRILVENRPDPDAPVATTQLRGYDPLCPVDYLFARREPLPESPPSPLKHFRPVWVAHSL